MDPGLYPLDPLDLWDPLDPMERLDPPDPLLEPGLAVDVNALILDDVGFISGLFPSKVDNPCLASLLLDSAFPYVSFPLVY